MFENQSITATTAAAAVADRSRIMSGCRSTGFTCTACGKRGADMRPDLPEGKKGCGLGAAVPNCKRIGSGEDQQCRDGRQNDELFHPRDLPLDVLVFCDRNPLAI